MKKSNRTFGDIFYKKYINLTNNLVEDFDRGLNLFFEELRNNDLKPLDFSLIYNVDTREFFINSESDNLIQGFNLIKIFRGDNFEDLVPSDWFLGPNLLDTKQFISFKDTSNPSIIPINKKDLFNIISVGVLSYNQKCSQYLEMDEYGFPIDEKLAIYLPLLDKENREKCFISSLRFFTTYTLASKRNVDFYNLLKNNNIKDVFFDLLKDFFDKDELNYFLEKTIIKEDQISIVYKDIVIMTEFLVKKEDRDFILGCLLEDIKNNTIVKKTNHFSDHSYFMDILEGTSLSYENIFLKYGINFLYFLKYIKNGTIFQSVEGEDILFETDLEKSQVYFFNILPI